MQFLLYGANGYTAQLIIPLAKAAGLTPVLAGRNEANIRPVAEQYSLEYRIADLNDPAAIDRALKGFPLVLHCAGPFIHTCKPMLEACLRNGVHYLDINGEVEPLKLVEALHEHARSKGVMLLPGVGFDVVPTDCMAVHLHQKMPDATLLQLAFTMQGGSISHGTAISLTENFGMPGQTREQGAMRFVPLFHKVIKVFFQPNKATQCLSLTWGDLITAYQSTRIPNIETYIGLPGLVVQWMLITRFTNRFMGMSPIKKIAQWWINLTTTGPDEKARQTGKSYIWGRIRNDKGEEIEARLTCPEAYALTAQTAVLITRKVLEGNMEAGFQTPAKLLGPDLILEIPGASWN